MIVKLSLFCTLIFSSWAAGEVPVDYRFKVETLLENVPQPLEIEFAPDGRLFFNEHGGALKIYRFDTRQVVEAGRLTVFNGQENGFLGFALDPQFSKNGWIYCLYSPKDYPGQYLSRFSMKGDQLDLASEKLMLKFEEQRMQCCHHAGSVLFGPDGCLYISTGDNTHPHGDSGGFAPLDERVEREPWNAQRSAANTAVLNGKILRIRPTVDGSYEIPQGNLFPEGTPNTRPEIYVMGCRNPWRMSIDPKSGYVYWGDVGPDAQADGPRGPRGYDEINQARKAGNFGWPYFIGNNFPYHRYDYVTEKPGAAFDPHAPVNESRLNTGLKELPPAQPAMIYWPYRAPIDFKEMGEGGRTACAGPVFHWQPSYEETQGFPKYFDGWLLFWDWERPTIRWAKLDAQSGFQGIAPFTSAVVTASKPEAVDKLKDQIAAGASLIKRPVNAVFGPDGCLYLMDFGETWGPNKDSKLVKISYLRGNLPPVARAQASTTVGREPLQVKLSSAGSHDREGDAIQYEWRLLPEDKVISTDAETSLTLDQPGNYQVVLHVKDAQGAVGSDTVPLVVGNAEPRVSFEKPSEGDFYTPGKAVSYQVAVADEEDGSSAAKPEEFSLRTLVTSILLDGEGKEQAADPGLGLVKASDCFNCHGVEQRIIGPGFLEIADKYRGQAGALDKAVERVRNGSTGVWGPIPMLPHPQHTTDEVNIMLRWVFGLEKGKGGPTLVRGLQGEITAPRSQNPGQLVLEASYTDAGRGPAGSLTGKSAVTMRSRRQEAEGAVIQGPRISNNGKCSGKKCLGSIGDKHHVIFSGIPLQEVGSMTVRATSGTEGGMIEFRSGAVDGPLLTEIKIPGTGSWDSWQEFKSGNLAPANVSENQDVYVVFKKAGGGGGLMNLDWVQFNPR